VFRESSFSIFSHHDNGKISRELWSWAGVGNVRIDNLSSQEAPPSYGSKPRKASVENVNHCLKALRKTIESEKFSSVALLKLATGAGGLDWKDVKPLIEKHLGNLAIPVYVYSTYQPGVKAKEQ
jgi:hypothetical protein